jgi:predicted transcriptional regulator
MTPKICCPSCRGSGTIDLPRVHREVLDLLQARGLTSIDVSAALNIRATTAINRLEFLRCLGLVDRWKQGRTYYYWLAGSDRPTDISSDRDLP